MNQHYINNKIKKDLILISLIFSFFLNANNTFNYITEIINNNGLYSGFTLWFYGLTLTCIISWLTIYINLKVLPMLYPFQERKSKILVSIIVNICLYLVFMTIAYTTKKLLLNIDKTIAYYFGWTVVYVFSYVIYSAINYQQKSLFEQKEKELLRTEKLRSELNEIKSVINPHFLFNSLNTLSALIQINKNNAGKFVTHLSRIYRYILSSKNKDLIPIEEELSFSNDYIQLIKIRHNDNFLVTVDIPINKRKYLIPPLAVQLLVENAEKHNVFSTDNPLIISITIEDDYLIVSHKLNERINTENSTGNGLSSLSKRCQILLRRDLIILKNKRFTVKIPMELF